VTAISFVPLDPSSRGNIETSAAARIYPTLTVPSARKRKFEEAETISNAKAKIGIGGRILDGLPAKRYV
jgi:hypothetical protein